MCPILQHYDTCNLLKIQFFFLYCSYLQYDQKPVSIIDTLAMTLKFVCQQGLVRGGGVGGEEEREMYVDVKPVELVGTDKITKKQRYPV